MTMHDDDSLLLALGRYGRVLDDAATAHASEQPVDAARDATAEIATRLTRTSRRRQLIAAAAVVAALAGIAGALAAGRDNAPTTRIKVNPADTAPGKPLSPTTLPRDATTTTTTTTTQARSSLYKGLAV